MEGSKRLASQTLDSDAFKYLKQNKKEKGAIVADSIRDVTVSFPHLYIEHCPFSVPFGMVNWSKCNVLASSKEALGNTSHAGFLHRKFGTADANTANHDQLSNVMKR